MRVNEILPVGNNKTVFNNISDPKISSEITQFYNELKLATDNFVHSSYELFPYEVVSSFLDDLSILKIEALKSFDPTNDIIRLITEMEDYLRGQ